VNLLVLSGDQPRHMFFVSRLLEAFPNLRLVVMRREGMMPTPPQDCCEQDRNLFVRHFELRADAEEDAFSQRDAFQIINEDTSLLVSPEDLNSYQTARIVGSISADVCIVFGTDLIKSPVLETLPRETFNVHLGLSPWYRGSATLFWPFYFMEPQWAGVTVHRLIEAVDHGEVVFQTVPELRTGMGIHDVGCAAVKSVCATVIEMLEGLAAGRSLVTHKQKSSGRIFRSRDFRPPHLRVNYEIFQDRMTDRWLNGELGGSAPKLLSLTHA